MSNRRSNKSVKRMMADVFDGQWVNCSPCGARYMGDVILLHVFAGWFGDYKTTVALGGTVSLTASELKGE